MKNIVDFEKAIKTPNFNLEPIVQEHATLLFEHLQSLKLYTYIPLEPPNSLVALEEKYKRWSARHSPDGQELWFNYAIYNPTAKEYVGTLQATMEIMGKTYIAYEVFPPHWKRGIGRETVFALISHLFNNYPITAIYAQLDTRNEASIRLLEGLQFHRKEIIENADYFKGCASHEYGYELTRNNWWKM